MTPSVVGSKLFIAMKLIQTIFKTKKSSSSEAKQQQYWQYWLPTCKYPKTVSFRAGDEVFKTVNSIFCEPFDGVLEVETPESWFTNSSIETESTESNHEAQQFESLIVHGAKSERLFFEGGETSSSILEKAKKGRNSNNINSSGIVFKDSVVLAMESEDPYTDFRRSMEEMMECCNGVTDLECLKELLDWYLKVNRKNNHGFIVGAFVDLLLDHLITSDHHDSNNFYTCSNSRPPLTCLDEDQTDGIHSEEI